MELDGRLLLVGCGKMGGALLCGWVERGLDPSVVTVVEPGAEARNDVAALGVEAVAGLDQVEAALQPAFVVLAVKPQMMDAILPDCRRFAAPGTAVLSIAAGTTLGAFEAALGDEAAVIRVMPNTPAAVGRGMSVLCANARVDDAQKVVAGALMAAVGEVAWIEDEALMDAVTGVSGSGPAYVFLMIESLAEAGVEAGLPRELATQLAQATVAGAGELARQSEETAAQLRRNVTSPGGTTAAALEVLMAEGGLPELMKRAVAAAARRGRELGA
ncbi:MAG: pyrroline-5-carboxylate reductase [Kiloniellales bacterium]|nr:pyrroline-5-carboxylate reductase [Kiloniellales bacterium]